MDQADVRKCGDAAKHFGALSGGLVAAASLLLEPVARIVFALGRGRRGDARPTAEGSHPALAYPARAYRDRAHTM